MKQTQHTTNTEAKRTAFKQVYEQYYGQIRNYLYYKSGDQELADDLLQEAFLKLWEKWEQMEQETLIRYLYTIARNLLNDQFRHQKVVYAFQSANPFDDRERESPEFSMEEKEFDQRLQQIIGNMPDLNREAFLMNRIEQLTYKQIAERLGISEKGVEKRMEKALRYLKENLPEAL